jgi:hypothetical protein
LANIIEVVLEYKKYSKQKTKIKLETTAFARPLFFNTSILFQLATSQHGAQDITYGSRTVWPYSNTLNSAVFTVTVDPCS